MKEGQPPIIRREEYRPTEFLIDETHLRFEIGEQKTVVQSRLQLRRNPQVEATTSLRLDGQHLELLALAIDGRALANNEYRVDDESLTLFDTPEQFELTCVTRIDPNNNTSLEGLYRSGGMYATQCEAEGFRKITYYLDRPDVMAKFTTTIIADGNRYPNLLANGNEISKRLLSDGRTEVTWEDPFPKPSYLFALVAGNLSMIEDFFVTASGRRVKLQIFTEPHNIRQCDYAMDALKRSMRWDEEVFGREYDLDIFMIVAVDHFNMGAMENKGLNIFNTSCVLAHPETTSDAGYLRVETVVSHEYFHNWSGNRVTCRDWFQLSLKEGFTVYRDQEFSADMGSRAVKRIADANRLRATQFAEDDGPMAHPIRPDSYIEISNFYTSTVYEKGAEVVRMLATLLGRDGFRRGTDLYWQRHDGTAATCEDFLKAMEDANGVNLQQFRRWYSQAGTPLLKVKEHFDAAKQRLTLTIEQSCKPTPGQHDKQPFHVPLLLGLIESDGKDLQIQGAQLHIDGRPGKLVEGVGDQDQGWLVELTAAKHELVFSAINARPVVSFLRQFSAPVRVEFARRESDYPVLMRHDRDGFCRWDAAQTFYTQCVQRNMRGEDATAALFEVVAALLDQALHLPDNGEAKALMASMLSLPAESVLAQEWSPVQVLSIHQAREHLSDALANELSDQWHALYLANRNVEPYQPTSAQIARRSLKNRALTYLARSRTAASMELLAAQFDGADNMTDRLAAFVDIHEFAAADLRERVLQDFYQRYRNEALVVDLWLSTQAASARAGGLTRVEGLEKHPAFDLKNPNKVRALYTAFTQSSANFHAADGSGYRFLADRVLQLNTLNPQIAARLVNTLSSWRRYAAPQADLMRRELEQLARVDDLSKDVYEMVNKSLTG